MTTAMNNEYYDIFIPSYHRPDNCKTANYFVRKVGWPAERVHIFIDSEADDRKDYEQLAKRLGCQLHVFDMDDARARYDYVHRASVSRRSAGQARNMMHDYARENGISFYMVQDDDTKFYQVRWLQRNRMATAEDIKRAFANVREFMERQHIGLFALSQCGDLIGGCTDTLLFRKKVMNTTFYLHPYIYRGERGVQDDDTSQFVDVMNEGLFTGSFRYGVLLGQAASATQAGGLTDLYNECKLLNKAFVVPIQHPTCARAEKQKTNGGRLHHRINYRYLMPCILKNKGGRSNIAWDTYPEDVPFTNEPKQRKYKLI